MELGAALQEAFDRARVDRRRDWQFTVKMGVLSVIEVRGTNAEKRASKLVSELEVVQAKVNLLTLLMDEVVALLSH